MKQLYVFFLILLCSFGLSAQVDSTLYYNSDESQLVYSKPNVNLLKLFGSSFSEHFAEVKYLASTTEFGVGFNYSHIPELWGYNVTAAYSPSSIWMGGGACLRLSDPWSEFDWHIYGNAGLRMYHLPDNHLVRPTLEVGFRWAKGVDVGKFSVNSGALGILTDFRQMYITINFGLLVGVLASTGLLMGVIN